MVVSGHLAQAIGQAAIQQGYRVLYRETHKLLDDLAEATIDGTRRDRSTTGANFSAIALPSPPCSIASFIMATFSNVVHGIGARKQTCLHRRRRSKTI
jgi:hypothetical protein